MMASPELAVAVRAGGGLVKGVLAGAGKVIALTPAVIVKLCVTGVAVAKWHCRLAMP